MWEFSRQDRKRERINVAMNANERSLFLRLFVSIKTGAS